MIDDDRPISAEDQDKFGFWAIAVQLADAVSSIPPGSDGLTVGVEGAWGTGKTSLSNLLVEALKAPKYPEIRTFRFSPWLMPTPQDYTFAFLNALANEIEKTSNDPTLHERTFGQTTDLMRGRSKVKLQSAADKLRQYAANVSHMAATALDAGQYAMLNTAKYAEMARKAGDTLAGVKLAQSADNLKAELVAELKRDNFRYVVIIDDLDRLEPREAIEVIRLVRSVADFPNVIYVLCYDVNVLAHAIEVGLNVPDGAAFLQKIVQIAFNIPIPEAFDLTQWLTDELARIYSEATGLSLDATQDGAIREAINYFSGRLTSPRQVKRLANSIGFHYRPVKDSVDFPDLCWLHAQKILNPALYGWIARYLPEMAVISISNAGASADETRKFTDELKAAFGNVGEDYVRPVLRLGRYIPGLAPDPKVKKTVLVFQDLQDKTIAALEQGKRLGSPAHYRFYFSFSAPKSTMSEIELRNVLAMAETEPAKLAGHFQALGKTPRLPNGTWFEYWLDWMDRTGFDKLSAQQTKNLALAIVAIIDDLEAGNRLTLPFGRPGGYKRAVSVVYGALLYVKQYSQTEFDTLLKTIVTEGRSIAWLVDEFCAREMLAHGRIGGRFSSDQYLTDTELDEVVTILRTRLLSSSDRIRLMSARSLVSLLYRWRELEEGDREEPARWFAEATQTDADFLDVLAKLASWRSTNGNVEYPIYRQDIDMFSNYEECDQRLATIAANSELEPQLAKKASELRKSIEDR